MPCAAIAASGLLWLAAAPIGAAPPSVEASAAEASVPGALEPLFVEIVDRAQRLKTEAEALRASGAPADEAFKTGIAELAELDMQGQQRVRERGADGDLACILRGIAEDLPVKLAGLQIAPDAEARDLALREMIYLLNDNIEVILAPPGVESGVPAGDAI